MHINNQASLHSQTALLNSLIQEWEIPIHDQKELLIPLTENRCIRVPLKSYSLLNRHEYEGKFFLNDKEITFHQVLDRLASSLASQKNASSDKVSKFIQRVKSSEMNIAQILSVRGTELDTIPQNFITAEQMLFAGHSLHPTPKGRDEFSDEDFCRYSPEMKGEFPLVWYEVSNEIFFDKQSRFFNDKEWLYKLFHDALPGKVLSSESVPFPMHPWQEKFILEIPDIKNYLNENKMRKIGTSQNSWAATSSLRTLYNQNSDYMLKFSMNVKLTNSIRHLLTHELDRGLQVHEIFNHPKGQDYSAHFPEFMVIHEPVYAGIKDQNGDPIKETLFLARFNPFKNGEKAFVLAALTQNHTAFETSPLEQIIHAFAAEVNQNVKDAGLIWYRGFLKVAIRPLILAQANYGFLLGSHQQNMIIELKDYRPVKSYFRDCNGTGFSPLGKKNFSSEIELITESNGNILPQEVTHYLFGYYVIINSVLGLTSALARIEQLSEDILISEFKTFLLSLKNENPEDPSFIDYLLKSKELMHKGNFFCTFNGVNENTESNPLSIYNPIPNPFYHKGYSI